MCLIILLVEFVQQHSFQFGSKNNPSFCVGVRFGLAPKLGKPVLACALDNSKIHVITWNGTEWITSQVLTGHEDWVRGLDFAPDGKCRILELVYKGPSRSKIR